MVSPARDPKPRLGARQPMASSRASRIGFLLPERLWHGGMDASR